MDALKKQVLKNEIKNMDAITQFALYADCDKNKF